MTRKHYEAVAKAVNETTLSASDKRALVDNLIREIGGLNANFKRSVFEAACGTSIRV